MVLSLVYAHIGTHPHYSWDHVLLHITLMFLWISIMLVGYVMVKKDLRRQLVSIISRMLNRKT